MQAGEGMVIHLADAAVLGALAAELSQPGKVWSVSWSPARRARRSRSRWARKSAWNAILRSRVAALPGVMSVEAV